MADNTLINPGSGGDTVRDKDRAGVKTQIVGLDVGIGTGTESLTQGYVPVSFFENVTYVCNTGAITGATATGTKSLAYIWHPASVALTYEIIRVNVNVIAGVGGGMRIELRRITAENATPGGSTGTVFPKNPGDAATGGTVRIGPTGAPTRQTGVYQGSNYPTNVNGNWFIPFVNSQAASQSKEYTMRASTAEGFEIVQEVTATISTAPVFNITVEWVES